MASSSPCDCWTHLSDSVSSCCSSSEHVWSNIKLPSLYSSPVDLDLNNHSCFHNQPPSTFLTLASTSASLLSLSNTNTNTNNTTHNHDQRHMRIIRNRESAVRSRARKQAYRKGLEVEIARLMEENSKLRRQLKELQCCLSFSDDPPRMGSPCKSSSSPF